MWVRARGWGRTDGRMDVGVGSEGDRKKRKIRRGENSDETSRPDRQREGKNREGTVQTERQPGRYSEARRKGGNNDER